MLGAGVHRTNGGGRARIELGEDALRYTLEHFLGENAQQAPADLERLEYGAVLVVAYSFFVVVVVTTD